MNFLFKIGKNENTVVHTTKRVAPKLGDIIDVKVTLDGVLVPKRSMAQRVRIVEIEATKYLGTIYVAEKLA